MRRPRINPVWLVAGLIVIAAIAGFVWLSQRGGEGAASREILLPDEGRAHVNVGDPLVYQNNPPASGTHYPSTADWRLYEETVSEGFWVHNLEHGGIVVLYKCPDGNCPERVQQLQALYDATPPSKYGNKKIVIVPYENMEAEFMAIAWNIQLPLMEFNQDAILGFYSRNVDHGPEDVA